MTRRAKTVAIIYGVLLVLTCIGSIFWPDDLSMPLPIAAVLGPFLTLRLGIGSGVPALVISLCLTAPYIFKQNIFTIAAPLLGLGLWLATGYFTGTLLYA